MQKLVNPYKKELYSFSTLIETIWDTVGIGRKEYVEEFDDRTITIRETLMGELVITIKFKK